MYVGPLNLIIPEGVLKNGSDVFNILDPDSGGAATFSVKLQSAALATFWGARTYLEQATYNALTQMTVTQFKTYVDQVATQRGRTPVGSVTAFKNAMLVDATMPFWTFVTANALTAVVDLAAAAKNA